MPGAYSNIIRCCPTTDIRVSYVPSVIAASTCNPRGSWCAMNTIVTFPRNWFTVRANCSAVADYAPGGMKALNDLSVRRNAGAIKLLEQMR